MSLTKGINIRQRFIIGYTVITMAISVTVLVSFLVFKKNKDLDGFITYVQIPALDNLRALDHKVVTSIRLSNNWIGEDNEKVREELMALVDKEIPKLIQSIEKDVKQWPSKEDQNQFIALKGEINTLLDKQRKITTTIRDRSDRSDEIKMGAAKDIIDDININGSEEIKQGLKPIIENGSLQFDIMKKEKTSLYNVINYMLVGLFALVVLINFFAVRDITKAIVKPLLEIKRVLFGLSRGEILPITQLDRADEIGDMNRAMEQMLEGINSKTHFAVQIGHGNYQVPFESSSDKDTLGLALLEMRENLKSNAEEERKRVWITTGQAQFGDVLRKAYVKIDDFYAEALMFVVKYLNANQGGLFVLDDTHQDPFLELVACYAYERRKFIGKQVQIGEGLVGQCFLERDMIYLTELPQKYVKITSGLGDATPTALLLVPLKLNDDIFGVIEIASFTHIPDYQINFVQRIAELMASSVSNMKVNERTKTLLQESQTLTMQLREQEEEMRQNMEELLATQEDLKRKEGKYLAILKEHGLSALE